MAHHLVSRFIPALSHGAVHGLVDRTPSPSAMQRIAGGYNYVTCRQKKVVFFRMQNFRAITGGLTAAIRIWPSYFRTGVNTNALIVRAGIVKTPFAATVPPMLDIDVHRASDNALITGVEVTFAGRSAGTSINPSEISYKEFLLEGLAADTEYYVDIEVTDGMCLGYLLISEATVRHADDTVAGVCSTGKYADEGPVYDEHGEDLVDANNRAIKQCGSHLLSWSCDYQASSTAPGIISVSGSTSYADLLSGRTQNLAAQYHNRRGQTTVPVKMAVLATRTGGAGTLDFRLTNGTSNLDVTGIGAGGATAWAVAAGTLPAALSAFKFQAKQSDTTTTHKVYGVSAFEYEA